MLYKRPRAEPVAIVGSACRFAGGATSPSRLWDLLVNPVDLSREIPKTRFNASAFYHRDGEYPGATNATAGYWLEEDYTKFDAQFFNITPKEAEAIDPQQRILLEVVYEALESAGCTLQTWAGRNVAVFAGLMTADYEILSQRDNKFSSQYSATGSARSILSNRISYFFDFHGASMTIDTACSASLVALHQAVQTLRCGDSEAAIVAGANLVLTPEQFLNEASLHMLSPRGRCHMWDISADGYARGEGVAALFLKPLSKALADGDTIHSLIRETGINSDGKTQGITMPNPEAQASLILDTYRRTGLDPIHHPEDRCQYFEAHGTGTPAGDPREAKAIHTAFFGSFGDVGGKVPTSDRLLVGSIKTVVGHTEGAAGLAGVLKVVQAMKHSCVPPNLHLHQLNPAVQPFYRHLQIPTVPTPWPKVAQGQPLRASVNSFGFGGANAHTILERFDPLVHNHIIREHGTLPPPMTSLFPCRTTSSEFCLPLIVSANSHQSLIAYCESLLSLLHENPTLNPSHVAWSLYRHRTTFPLRLALSGPDLVGSLQNVISSPSSYPGIRARTLKYRPRVLGIFTGQGAQWATMATGLLHTSKVFAQTLAQLEKFLTNCPDPPTWSLTKELLAPAANSRVGEAAISQPLCTAIQIAFVDLLRALGIEFRAVLGHSSGEIAAAYAAGRLSAKDAMLISYSRGMVAHLNTIKPGAMIATGLGREQASALCITDEFRGRVSLAASNSATSTTLSGDSDAIILLEQLLRDQGIFVTRLRVDTAYHSHHMKDPGNEYSKYLQTFNIGVTNTENFSSITWMPSVASFRESGRTPSSLDLQAQYWVDNMVEPVFFHEALTEIISKFSSEEDSFDCIIEVGPRPHLRGPVTHTLRTHGKGSIPYSGVLNRKLPDAMAFSEFLGFMWTHFGPSSIDLEAYIDDNARAEGNAITTPKKRLELPSYAWDHSEAYYRESRISRQYHFRSEPLHELLGARTRDDTDAEMRWRNYLKLQYLPWIEGHKFQGTPLLPASAYCIMALDAARSLLRGRKASLIELSDLKFIAGIPLEKDTHGVEILFSLSVSPNSDENQTHASFSLMSCSGDGKASMGDKPNFSGNLTIVLGEPDPDILPVRPNSCAETLPSNVDTFYSAMEDIGLLYTGPFRALQTIDRRYNYASTTLNKVHPEDTTSLTLSPATLDSCFQTVFSAFSSPGDKAIWTSFLPTRIERLTINMATLGSSLPNNKLTVDSHITQFVPTSRQAQAQIQADVLIYNGLGALEVQVEGLWVQSFGITSGDKTLNNRELYLHTTFEIDPECEIVPPKAMNHEVSDSLLEACLRVAQFYLRGSDVSLSFEDLKSALDISSISLLAAHPKLSQIPILWPDDTEASINNLIQSSPYFATLDFVRDLGRDLPDILLGMLPTILTDASQLGGFQAHIEEVVHQICHRYPQMNILAATDPDHALTCPILGGVGNSFQSITIASEPEPNIYQLIKSDCIGKKVRIDRLKLVKDLEAESNGPLYDLAIISTSELEDSGSHIMLKNIRDMMRPGGFLLLVHVARQPLKNRIRRFAGLGSRSIEPLTPPDWPDSLDCSGFVPIGNSLENHSGPGFSLIMRQADSLIKSKLAKPLSFSGIVAKELLIIGGQSEETAQLRNSVKSLLSSHVQSFLMVDSLENVEYSIIDCHPAILMLSDLDASIMINMSTERLNLLRSLFTPNTTVLWTTCRARENPEHAATFGWARSITAEIPNLSLQILDLENLNSPVLIAEAFLRLAIHPINSEEEENKFLWTAEREIFVEDGKYLIPRVLPYTPGNDRFNAARRVIPQEVSTLEENVAIEIAGSELPETPYLEARLMEKPKIHPGSLRVAVEHSSVRPLRVCSDTPVHLCIGRDTISRPERRVLVTSPYISLQHWLGILVRTVISSMVLKSSRTVREIVLLEPDAVFAKALKTMAAESRFRVRIYNITNSGKAAASSNLIHVNATFREISQIFSSNTGRILNFLPTDHKLSTLLLRQAPSFWKIQHISELLPLIEMEESAIILDKKDWYNAIELTNNISQIPGVCTGQIDSVSVPEALSISAPPKSLAILDWRAERHVQCTTPSRIAEPNLLSPDKTYVLVGLTRDLGQSLCILFASHGARNLVIASRNPNTQLIWADEMAKDGVRVIVERLDITNLDLVRAFKNTLTEEYDLPPIGGVVNGAMVLDDRVFAQMDIETWDSVLRPKTVGSKNLDIVFDNPELEFFIMTSSFAATGGHGGQSNYAAANMYMNGLAENRRRRGLPGSAINIGVIYGIGLLHRDSRNFVYSSLEREGYPPISERDIHHMFLEAIVAGRPPPGSITPTMEEKGVAFKTGPGLDLTCGLSRYDPTHVHLHWHHDPRFGHFVVDRTDTSKCQADNGSKNNGGMRLLEMIRGANSADEASACLFEKLRKQIHDMLKISEDNITPDHGVSELGIDSLAAVEIRSWIFKSLEVDLSVMKILGVTNLGKLCREITAKALSRTVE